MGLEERPRWDDGTVREIPRVVGDSKRVTWHKRGWDGRFTRWVPPCCAPPPLSTRIPPAPPVSPRRCSPGPCVHAEGEEQAAHARRWPANSPHDAGGWGACAQELHQTGRATRGQLTRRPWRVHPHERCPPNQAALLTVADITCPCWLGTQHHPVHRYSLSGRAPTRRLARVHRFGPRHHSDAEPHTHAHTRHVRHPAHGGREPVCPLALST
jgi:hypothetical protein